MKTPETVDLKTPFESSDAYSWKTEHPSPRLKRNSWMTLCGPWALFLDSGELLGEITVPFPPESRLSGKLCAGESYLCKKAFTLPDTFLDKRVLLHFGAVDQICTVEVNGRFATSNVGGYLPFCTDITELLQDGENFVTVKVTDRLDKTLPYGKQTKKRGGMWYTAVSGIWQPVWLEAVPRKYIESLRITPTLDSVTVETRGGEDEKLLLVDGKEYRYTGDRVTVKIDSPKNWTPEEPYLYDITLTSGEDTVESYFALRTVTVENRRICLNGRPYFFNGLLDQGYYLDGIFTPATPEGYLFDILNVKRMGFNMLRKHIKIEPDVFYYYCDKYGMAVFQDMVNSGSYSFILDTALPTVGIKKGLMRPASKKRKELFEKAAENTVSLLYSHPSVVYYTIFNEGWGQYKGDLYRKLKALDSTRIYDTASGWFKTKDTDVESEHVYFRKLNLKPSEKPLVLSEFGGYSCKIEGHVFNLQRSYGYKTINTAEELTSALEDLYLNEVLPMIDRGLSAAVLTQVSDIEDEINGLFTYDRQVIKPDVDRMLAVSEKLTKKFYGNLLTK